MAVTVIPARPRIAAGWAAAALSAASLCFWALRVFSAPEDAQIHWSNILWAPMQVDGVRLDHAALMVEAAIEGASAPVRMQLDLGTYGTVMYRSAYRRLRGVDPATPGLVPMSGSIAGRPFHNEQFGFRADEGGGSWAGPPMVLGSLGSSFFERRVLILDFVRQRLAILGRNARVPIALERSAEFLPAAFRYGHVVVAATIDGRPEPNLMFDTGSSGIPLFTGHGRWTALTHRTPADPANTIMHVGSWGREAILIGAPLPGALCVGSACLSHPVVYCEGSHLPNLDFDRHADIAAGVIGNVLFDGRFTVIVDIARRRFGLLRGSPAI